MDVLACRILIRPADFARSRAFYEDTLGLAVFREWEAGDHSGVVFYVGGGLLELSGTGGAPGATDLRVMLEIRDVAGEAGRLEAAGVPFVARPALQPWGLVEATIRDPDGVRIVLVEVPSVHPRRRAG